jgi:diguanylate cyclase (GGDEF)-like protein/PAS domain S-box-containing protein
MTHPPPDSAAHDRLQALRALALDGPADPLLAEELGRIAAITAKGFGVPWCTISTLDDRVQRIIGAQGLPLMELPLSKALCTTTVTQDAPLLVPDARADARFADFEVVTGDPHLRFYAGYPLHDDHGTAMGTLCLMSPEPTAPLNEVQQRMLQELSLTVADLLVRRRDEHLLRTERRLLAEGPMGVITCEDRPGFPLLWCSDNLAQVLGPDARVPAPGEPLEPVVHAEHLRDLRASLRSLHATGLEQAETIWRVAGAPDARARWVRQISRRLPAPDGHAPRVVSYLFDETRQRRLELKLSAAHERLNLALASAAIGSYEMDARSGLRHLDDRAAALIGLRPSDLDPHREFWESRIHPFDRAAYLQVMEDCRVGRTDDPRLQYRVRHAEGHYVWIQSWGSVVARGADGLADRLVGTLIDITERKREELTRNRQRRLMEVLNHVQTGFMVSGDLRQACDAMFEPLLQLTESGFGFIGLVRHAPGGAMELHVPTISNISWDDATRALFERHQQGIEGLVFRNLDNLFGRVVTHDEVVMTNAPETHHASRGLPPGHPTLESFLGLPIRFDGRVTGMIGLGNRTDGFGEELVSLLQPLLSTLGTLFRARDLEEARRQAEAEMHRRATTDELTGVANRRAFLEAARLAQARARRDGVQVCLALLDLDHFKRVNDTHGHAVGDEVLRHFASVVGAALREGDLLGRVGGEEFGVLLHAADPDAGSLALARVLGGLRARPVTLAGGEALSVTASAGLAAWHAADAGIEGWLQRADAALYAAKAAGRDRVVSADPPAGAAATAAAD